MLKMLTTLATLATFATSCTPAESSQSRSSTPPSTAAPDVAPGLAASATIAATTTEAGDASASGAATTSATTSATPSTAVAAGAEDLTGRIPDIEYVPTPQNVVDKLLDVAKIGKTDVLYDLGCGDGRIVINAAKKFGIKAIGFDIDPKRVAESRANVKSNGVEHLVTIEHKDIFTVDLSPASVVTLYLLPELNVRLIPQLQKLKPGARVVSHDFDMEGVDPEQTWTVIARDHRTPKNREHYVYLWKTPIKTPKAPPKAK